MKKTIATLVLVAIATLVGFSVKVGPDPIKMAKVEVGCPIVVNGIAELCYPR